MTRPAIGRAGRIWALTLLLLSVWVAGRLLTSEVLVGDLQALLPKSAREPVVEAATQITQQRLERRLVLVVGGRTSAAGAAETAKLVRRRLVATHLLRPAPAQTPEDNDALGKLYYEHRFGLVDAQTHARLVAGAPAAALERAALKQYFSPTSAAPSQLIEHDPLLLLPAFLSERMAAAGGNVTVVDGEPIVADAEGGNFAVLEMTLQDTPFSMTLQDAVTPALEALRAELAARRPSLALHMAGVLPHAAAGTAGAREEVSTIGTASLVAVVLVLVAAFRSSRPLVFSLVTIGVGCLVGLAACLAIFDSVHLFTLVFAISLVGTAEDFTFHFFATRFGEGDRWRPDQAMRHVLPSITLGLLTTLIGFVGMMASGVPGLIQISVFSIAGLTAAFASTVWWYPLFAREAAPYVPGLLSRLADRWLAWWDAPVVRQVGMLGLAILAIAALFGSAQLTSNDDVRQFQALDGAVVADEQIVKRLLDGDFAGQFLLVQGRNAEEVLQREEAAAGVLKRLVTDGRLRGHVALSQLVPSTAWQRQNVALLRAAAEDGLVTRVARRVGLSPDVAPGYVAALDRARPLSLEAWLAHPASAASRQLWLGALPVDKGTGHTVVGSVMLLRGVSDPAALGSLALPDGVQVVDPVATTSQIFAKYRQRALWLIVGSYALVGLLLVQRYGLRGGALIAAVPITASLACAGAFGALGIGFSLFHTMALLLVLGMGVDYGIFFRESDGADRATLIAIAMSVITTLLSFGLLGLSRTAAISAFGQTVSLGIIAAFLIAPIARPAARSALPVTEELHVS